VTARRTVQNLRLSWETFEVAMISPSLKRTTTHQKYEILGTFAVISAGIFRWHKWNTDPSI